MISTRNTLLTDNNPFSATTTEVEENVTLLLNEAGDAAFDIDTGEIKHVLQRKERDTTTNSSTNTFIHAGYDIYTRDSDDAVKRFSFDINGHFKVRAKPWKVNELRQEEALTRLDLSGNNIVSTTIRGTLFTGVATTSNDIGTRSLYQSDDGLLISTSVGLTTDKDLANPSGGIIDTDEQQALFLSTGMGMHSRLKATKKQSIHKG